MAVKRYDGSAWQVVAGKGDQGTSSSISTWVKTASGGETSLSGNDDNSQSLSYTVGQELVFINGTLLKRGSDYTATTGTSITGLTALAANDVATVWTVNAFSVTNAISNTLVDAKGDLIVATAADTPARLAVGANDTVLTADSSTATGLKWATPSSGFPAVTSFTPTVTAQSGTITSYTANGYYTQSGKIVVATYRINLTNVGTAAANMIVTLPINAVSGTTKFWTGSCIDMNTTGKAGIFIIDAQTNASTLTSRDYNFSTWFVNGYIIVGTIAYEVA